MEQKNRPESPGSAYEAPEVVTLGSFEDLTQGTSSGAFTDAFFPAHTPRGDLTFS